MPLWFSLELHSHPILLVLEGKFKNFQIHRGSTVATKFVHRAMVNDGRSAQGSDVISTGKKTRSELCMRPDV